MDQFCGRGIRVCDLPETLSRQNLKLVTRIHIPSLQDAPLKLAIGAALASDCYPKAVEDVASSARWNAHKRNSKAISRADVEAAIREVVPGAVQLHGGSAAAPAPETRETAAVAPQARRQTSAEVIQDLLPGAPTSFPARSDSDPSHEAWRVGAGVRLVTS
jgi:hypothetical protein